ncbi:sulfurtransferase TusA family protein [Psychromonas sp.]|uniref:sulfurtransferase TusA family protein n=1 Tax=Psychromonas sp. TaxID=1884585 RepID=UPI0035650B80
MEILDLQNMRCPMSLIKLKRYLLLHHTPSTKLQDHQLCLLFSSQQAMQDITLYLDKKMYDYSIIAGHNQVMLVMKINANNLY